jgi:signal peptidase I
MSDQGSVASTSAPPEQIAPANTKANSKKLLFAAFLSLVFPGAGHLLLHRYRKATILAGLFFLIILSYWPLRAPSSVVGLLLLVIGTLVLCFFTVVNVCYSRENKTKLSQWWLLLLLPMAAVAVSAHSNWLLRVSGFQSFVVPSQSMAPTVPMGGHLLVDRRYYQNHSSTRADIVIFINPQNFYLVKRVIARGGETIEGKNGKIFIDGKLISEPYVTHSRGAEVFMDNFGPLKIPAGKLFVMGDNRDVSLDSRSPDVGPIDEGSLRGKPLYLMGDFKNKTYKVLQ